VTRAALLALVAAGCAAPKPAAPSMPAAAPPAPPVEAAPVRLFGELPPAPAGIAPRGSILEGSYRVCLDQAGRVHEVKPAPGIAGADDVIVPALRGWSWFVVTERAGPPCFAATVLLPVPDRSQITRAAGPGIFAPLHNPTHAHLPVWLRALYGGRMLEGMYKVCIGGDGLVERVRPLVSVPGADDVLMAGLRASTWDVRVGTLAQPPFCFGDPVRIDLRDMPASDATARPPSTPYPPAVAARVEPGVSMVLHVTALDHAAPHVGARASYRYCFGADGAVATVEPIVPVPGNDREVLAALKRWQFDVQGPPGVGACSVARLGP
jgi:hypothetical protein